MLRGVRHRAGAGGDAHAEGPCRAAGPPVAVDPQHRALVHGLEQRVGVVVVDIREVRRRDVQEVVAAEVGVRRVQEGPAPVVDRVALVDIDGDGARKPGGVDDVPPRRPEAGAAETLHDAGVGGSARSPVAVGDALEANHRGVDGDLARGVIEGRRLGPRGAHREGGQQAEKGESAGGGQPGSSARAGPFSLNVHTVQPPLISRGAGNGRCGARPELTWCRRSRRGRDRRAGAVFEADSRRPCSGAWDLPGAPRRGQGRLGLSPRGLTRQRCRSH